VQGLNTPLIVPARGDASIVFPFNVNLTGLKHFDVKIRYSGENYQIIAKQRVRIGRDSLKLVQRQASSIHKSIRSQAVVYVRYRLRVKQVDAKFLRVLRAVSYSTYRDVRLGVAQALREFGQKGTNSLIDIACRLAADPDAAVSHAAFVAVVALCRSRTTNRKVLRLASATFAKPGRRGSASLLTAIKVWQPVSRRRFLGSVLSSTRSRIAHKEIAAILRRDGVPVEPGPSGLVPWSQIAKLRR
jgi:hypothetical protein